MMSLCHVVERYLLSVAMHIFYRFVSHCGSRDFSDEQAATRFVLCFGCLLLHTYMA